MRLFSRQIRQTNPAAVIPVEKPPGKIMLVCGEVEKLWTSCPITDQIVERAAVKTAPASILLRDKDAGREGSRLSRR